MALRCTYLSFNVKSVLWLPDVLIANSKQGRTKEQSTKSVVRKRLVPIHDNIVSAEECPDGAGTCLGKCPAARRLEHSAYARAGARSLASTRSGLVGPYPYAGPGRVMRSHRFCGSTAHCLGKDCERGRGASRKALPTKQHLNPYDPRNHSVDYHSAT